MMRPTDTEHCKEHIVLLLMTVPLLLWGFRAPVRLNNAAKFPSGVRHETV
jgi:hypothetical protein